MSKEQFKEFMKPINKVLFGQEDVGRSHERPHFQVRPLEMILEDLLPIPPLEWFDYVFGREPLSGKINEEQRRRYMREAWECGCEYAERIKTEYGSDDPGTIAKAMGMEVSYPTLPDKTDRILFAEFREPNKIKIFMDAVKKADKYLAKPEIQTIFKCQVNVSKILLAHELFHAVEEKYSKEIYTKTERIRLWSIGFIHNDSQIIVLSEIAAMAFAATLTKFPYSPYILDVFLVYGYSPEEASGLYDEIMGDIGKRTIEEKE